MSLYLISLEKIGDFEDLGPYSGMAWPDHPEVNVRRGPPDPSVEKGTTVDTISQQAARLNKEWETDPRWKDTSRTYSAEDVVRLRGSVQEEYTLARLGAERLRALLASEDSVTALGAITGNQAVQQVKAGLKAIYLSGWQVAADGNLAGQTYPDQSLYPANSVPQVVRRINNALLRADQISWSESADGDVSGSPHWLAPIVADAEAGFGGVLNAYELMKSMIAAGAAGRALGRPARVREEVRPPGREGPHPDGPAHQDAERRPAGRRRVRRADAGGRAH